MLNWYLTIRNLAKTDTVAAELFDLLKKAETDEEKETAKQKAQDYINQINDNDRAIDDTETKDSQEEVVAESPVEEDSVVDSGKDIATDNSDTVPDNTDTRLVEKEEKEISKTDLSGLAFTPRLAKCGITREEELFLNGILTRKMNRAEKILMRRSIYEKKTKKNAEMQALFRAKRLEQRQKDLNDPEKQKFHQERKYVAAVVKALENRKNFVWIFSQIDGLTPDIMRELLKKPEVASAIKQEKASFITDFYKKYGE